MKAANFVKHFASGDYRPTAADLRLHRKLVQATVVDGIVLSAALTPAGERLLKRKKR